MICTTQVQAERVAESGAKKMNESGVYSCSPYSGETYKVSKPGQADPYFVSVTAKSCTCGFFWDNSAHGVCKHLLWLEGEIDWVNRLEAEAEERNFYEM
ncbi:MAG: hypothetical protein V4671_23840 [Armatimonadota bacterium]